jgi:hypothetical protein
VSDSIAESLSTIGLVAGFPLLLMCFMLSLEKLESWGLRESEPSAEPSQADRIEAAMDAIERLATTSVRSDADHADGNRPVVAHQGAGAPDGRPLRP